MERLQHIDKRGNTVLEKGLVSASLLATLALSACSYGGPPDTQPEPQQPKPEITDIINEASEELKCYTEDSPFVDCDEDGVANYADVVIGRDDNADDDLDSVANNRDRAHGVDDTKMDIDRDGYADWYDTFYGNNFNDEDSDGLINGLDPQPYVAPPSGVAAVPATQADREYAEQVLLNQQNARTNALLYGPLVDRDGDRTPDNIDSRPTGATNDYDGDGDPDWYDPDATDPYLDSYNDPWDSSNEEYWEEDSWTY